MTIDSEQLRRAMRTWTTGVAVITAMHDGQQYGMTVNSFSSVSLEPPLIAVTLKQLTHTHELVVKSGEFSITILSSDQKELADRFAGKTPDIKDRFAGVPTETLVINAPLLKDGIAYFNCRVLNSIPIGENTFFLAEVIAASGEGKGEPLVYHNRVYWKLILPLSSPPITSKNLEESQRGVRRMEHKLTPEEQKTLIHLAREAIECRVKGEKLWPLDQSSLPFHLREQGASFITLTVHGQLRGCIGALEPYQPLADDVREHAVAAALEDPRFPPVQLNELNGIKIEVSRLTRPIPLDYKDAEDLLSKLHPNVDGVILRDSTGRHATFLPQVWEKIRNPAEFMDNLCSKLGLSHNSWRSRHFDVLTYQVEEFHE